MSTFSLTKSPSSKLPRLPFLKIKEAILGKPYELSLVFPSRTVATKLHKEWKKKDGPANVLSFPFSKNHGEIFISLDAAKTEHAKFELSYRDYIAYLFIHGCLHLKGFLHGATMEREEQKFMKRFSR